MILGLPWWVWLLLAAWFLSALFANDGKGRR